MNTSTSYYVETKGIQLPDGTTWGACKEEKLRVVSEEMRPNLFLVYEIFGNDMLGEGKYCGWREMREKVAEFVNYQLSIGNKVYEGTMDQREIKAITYKETTYC